MTAAAGWRQEGRRWLLVEEETGSVLARAWCTRRKGRPRFKVRFADGREVERASLDDVTAETRPGAREAAGECATFAEIGAALGVSETMARKVFNRALRRFIGAWGEADGTPVDGLLALSCEEPRRAPCL